MQNLLDSYFPKKIKYLTLTPDKKLIVMSDMHRGDGAGSDDFAHNSLIYKCALRYYFDNGYTYIELGDAEELWENKTFDQIYITYTSIYDELRKFHNCDPEKTRYIKIWGNHDIIWEENEVSLGKIFPSIKVYEAVIINFPSDRSFILLLHGHQVDPKCRGGGAAISKFFVRRFWRFLQKLCMKDPTRAAANPGLCNEIDEELHNFAKSNDKNIGVVIAGHTHRPVYENLSLTERKHLQSRIGTDSIRKKPGTDPTYYNTGSCVHPHCITGIEIVMKNNEPSLNLIKWAYHTTEPKSESSDEYTLTVKRTLLEPKVAG